MQISRGSIQVVLFWLFGFAGCKNSANPDFSSNLVMKSRMEKVWAHRVNSTSVLKEKCTQYAGIEVDVFYDKETNDYFVKHDKLEHGVTLSSFLDTIVNFRQTLIWIDLKNLNEVGQLGRARLEYILTSRNLSKSVLIESYFGRDLEKLTGTFATSYWVGSNTMPSSKREQNQVYQEKYRHIRSLNVNMLSASYEMFEFLSEYFPDYRVNYWIIGSLTGERLSTFQKMIESENVNIILIDEIDNPMLLN